VFVQDRLERTAVVVRVFDTLEAQSAAGLVQVAFLDTAWHTVAAPGSAGYLSALEADTLAGSAHAPVPVSALVLAVLVPELVATIPVSPAQWTRYIAALAVRWVAALAVRWVAALAVKWVAVLVA
jgi:hypothetical protein